MELCMTSETPITFGSVQVDLNPSPIRSSWIREGKPVARNKVLSSSADGTASTLIWDCTAGRFDWHYDINETIYVLEGSVVVKDHARGQRHLVAGDTVFFPAGSHAEWYVEGYVRKLAFCHIPLPHQVLLAKRIYRRLKRLLGNGGHGAPAGDAPSMFSDS
jgi:hypothetical protein